MPQTWDEHGNPIASPEVKSWDEHGNPISAAPVQSTQNSVNASLSKATGISGGATILDRLRAGQVPVLDELQQAYGRVGNQAPGEVGLAPESTLAGKIGQMAGILLKNPASQAIAGTIAPEMAPEASIAKDWQKINDIIGATKKSVILPKTATDIEAAVKMPARGLMREGLDASSLSKMSPLEQQSAVAPMWNKAGQNVDKLIIDATSQNVTLNPSESALKIVSDIQNPKLQEKAVKELSGLMEELGIRDASKATPLEQLQLRRALKAGARFRDGGDLSSLGGIRAKLYSAVSDDLQGAVEGLKDADQHYGDLDSALKAMNSAAQKQAVTAPPTLVDKLKPALYGGGAAATLYKIWNMYRGR